MPKIKRGKPSQPNQPNPINKARGKVSFRLIKEYYRKKRDKHPEALHGWYDIIWIVQWSPNTSADGKEIPSTPQLERRKIYIRKDGHITTYQAEGLKHGDLKIVAENWGEISTLVTEQ